MFILVSSWRYTSFKLSTEERLGQTLKDAAVSITITSITDALAFGIGMHINLLYNVFRKQTLRNAQLKVGSSK